VFLASDYDPPAAFPLDVAVLSVQLMAFLCDARTVAFSEGAGADWRDKHVQMLLGTGMPNWAVQAVLLDSFEALHKVQGFPAAPSYHQLQRARFIRRYKPQFATS